MKKTSIIIILLLSGILSSYAQRGGESVFGLLHLTQSARVASLGGNQVGIEGHDLSMLIHNPAILDSTLEKQISMSFVPYMAGINYGFGAVAWSFKDFGNVAVGFHHIGYGSFTQADEYGIISGSFSAGESMLQLSFSRKLSPKITAGITLKPLYSQIESYNSFGIASDLGLFFRNQTGLFSAGMVFKNYGQQLTSYHDAGALETLKPDLQIGISQKLEHAPFRFSLTVQDLLSKSIQYNRPEDQPGITFSDSPADDGFFEKAARHLTIGMEFTPTQTFYLAAGINPRRRSELKIDSRTSTVGFTWGFGIKIYKFNFAYGSGRYHLGGSSNHFSISTNLSRF